MDKENNGLSSLIGDGLEAIGYNGVAKGLEIEKQCRERAARVCDGINEIHSALEKIRELAIGISETWESIKDTPEVANGELPRKSLEPIKGIIGYATKASPVFVINKASHLAPYDRNIEDMSELLAVMELHERTKSIIGQISKTDKLRRKPLYRELKRAYSAIVSGSVSIINGHYASENVPEDYSEAVYGFVKSMVDEAKDGIKMLKNVA